EGTAVAPIKDGALLHGIDHEDAFPERVVEEPGPAVVAVLELETIGVCLKNRVKGPRKCSPNAACHPRILKNRGIFVKICTLTPRLPHARRLSPKGRTLTFFFPAVTRPRLSQAAFG
ncbi:MAG: hypothetical protein RLZZ142_2521, partial [Verrucomicrobiota bacterium]